MRHFLRLARRTSTNIILIDRCQLSTVNLLQVYIMKKYIFALGFMAIAASGLLAQEFNTKVTISTPKLQKADPKIFKTLQGAIADFMNSRKWSDQEYRPEERIDMNINIMIDQEVSDTKFTGQLIIQTSRPVFNSTYSTVMLENVDKDFTFEYREFEALEYSDNAYFANLTSMLAFYAYVSLGLDGDSFSELGGETYFQKANSLVQSLPQTVTDNYGGWKPFGTQRNRYWLIENILSVRFQPMRRALYAYHLGGLDQLYANPAQGQLAMKTALEDIKAVNQSYPGTMFIQLFCNAKRQEIINVFQPTDIKVKQAVFDNVIKMDGTNTEKYRVMLKS